MINEETGVLETPYNLATLSKITGNPMLDLGYQCCDMRPFFPYNRNDRTYYTIVHPKNLTSQVINVYEKYIKNVDGIDYVAMKYVGTTTETTENTITYEGTVYVYQDIHENVRGFFINKWARYKSIQHGKNSELTEEDRILNSYGLVARPIEFEYGTALGSQNMLEELKQGKTYWYYEAPTEGDWFRKTDFIGYYPKAKSPFFLELAYNQPHHKDDEGVSVLYISNKYQNTYDLDIRIGSEPSEGVGSPSLNWHDITSVFGMYAEDVTDFTDPENFENIVEFYNDKCYGLVYFDGKNYKWTPLYWEDLASPEDNPENKKGAIYPVCSYIPPNTDEGEQAKLQQDQVISITVQTEKVIEVGGVICNSLQGRGNFYHPTAPLRLKVRAIPDIVKAKANYYADGPDFIVEVELQRNGTEWWWGVNQKDTDVTGIVVNASGWSGNGTWTQTDGHLRVTGFRKNSTGDIIPDEFWDDTPTMRECLVNGVEVENWNGWINSNTQQGISTPIFKISPISGVGTATLRLIIPEFAKNANGVLWDKEGGSWLVHSAKITLHLAVYVNESVTFSQLLTFDLGGLEVFNNLGDTKYWPSVNNEE